MSTTTSTSGLSAIQQLAAAEIALFGSLLLVTGFIAVKHGAKGIMVWHMLIGMCIMALVISILHILQKGDPRKYGAGVAFANSGILAMLCLVPIGLIYEVSVCSSMLEKHISNNNYRCLFIPTIGLWTNRLNLALFHIIPLVSIILAQVFAAPKSHETTGDHSPVNASLAKTGFLLMLFCMIALFAEATYLLVFRVREASNYNTSRHLKTLLFSLVAALPFAMIRMGHEVAYIFDPSTDRNLEVGAFMDIFFIAFLMPLAFTIPLVVGGFLTRNINTADLELVREGSRRPFREEVELKDAREEVEVEEEQQHNRRPETSWLR